MSFGPSRGLLPAHPIPHGVIPPPVPLNPRGTPYRGPFLQATQHLQDLGNVTSPERRPKRKFEQLDPHAARVNDGDSEDEENEEVENSVSSHHSGHDVGSVEDELEEDDEGYFHGDHYPIQDDEQSIASGVSQASSHGQTAVNNLQTQLRQARIKIEQDRRTLLEEEFTQRETERQDLLIRLQPLQGLPQTAAIRHQLQNEIHQQIALDAPAFQNLQNNLAEEALEGEDLLTRLEEEQDQVAIFQQRNTQLKDTLKALTNQIVTMEQSFVDPTPALMQQIQEARIMLLRQTRAGVSSQIENLEREARSLLLRLHPFASTAEAGQIKDRLLEKLELIVEHKNTFRDLQNNVPELGTQQLLARLEEEQAQVTALQVQIVRITNALSELKRPIEGMEQNFVDRTPQLERTIQQERIQHLTLQRTALLNQLEALKERHQELANRSGKITLSEELKLQLTTLGTDITQDQNSLRDLTTELPEEITQRLATLEQQTVPVQAIQARRERYGHELTALNNQISDLEKEQQARKRQRSWKDTALTTASTILGLGIGAGMTYLAWQQEYNNPLSGFGDG